MPVCDGKDAAGIGERRSRVAGAVWGSSDESMTKEVAAETESMPGRAAFEKRSFLVMFVEMWKWKWMWMETEKAAT